MIYASDFEDEGLVLQEWSAEGSGKGELAVLSEEKAASGKRSLAVVDHDPQKYAAWQSPPIDLPQKVLDRGSFTLSWKELYSVTGGQIMRFSIKFLGDNHESTKHFPRKGESEGWSEGRFSEESVNIPIPAGATRIWFKLGSAVGTGTDGEYYIDDLRAE